VRKGRKERDHTEDDWSEGPEEIEIRSDHTENDWSVGPDGQRNSPHTEEDWSEGPDERERRKTKIDKKTKMQTK